MAKTHLSYAPEYQRQRVELVRSGRTPKELARAFEGSASAIRNRVRQADRDEGPSKPSINSLGWKVKRTLFGKLCQRHLHLEGR